MINNGQVREPVVRGTPVVEPSPYDKKGRVMTAAAKSTTKTKTSLHQTRNDTKSNAVKVSLDTLQERLADGIDLALDIKQAHWNLKGPQFIAIHEMLDGFRDEMDDLNDKVAERITQLGGTARGTVQTVGSETSLPAYPMDIYDIGDHLAALIDRFATYANAIRRNIDDTDEAGDVGTADIFTEISRAVDKQLWFLEAHVQEPMGRMRDGDGAAGKKR